tara:strand:+ start:1505 stop:2041 length:537 start_codon:yes stop_codon:yes gene_type:complete
MKNNTRLEIGVSQSLGVDGNYIATTWYVNNKLQLSFTERESLPSVISLDLYFPATVTVVFDGMSVEKKTFSIDTDSITLYEGNTKFKLTEKQAQALLDLNGQKMHYSTEEDIRQGINLKFTNTDPNGWILDCFKEDMIYRSVTEQELLLTGVSQSVELNFKQMYIRKQQKQLKQFPKP